MSQQVIHLIVSTEPSTILSSFGEKKGVPDYKEYVCWIQGVIFWDWSRLPVLSEAK